MASSLKRDFDDNLSCPVCLENFAGEHIPKDLDCPHVCCQKCLNEMPSDIIGGLKCPQCQRITTIPDGGVAALRTNLLVRSLSETLQSHKQAEDARSTKQCPSHDDQEVLFFCITCKHSICQYCIIHDHLSHKYEPIQSLAKTLRQKVGRALQKVKVQIEICEQYNAKVTENEEMLTAKFKKAETKIDARIQTCVDEVNSLGEQLKKKLDELKSKTLEIVQKEKRSNQGHLQNKREVVEETESCLERASDSEYLVLDDKLFGKLKMSIEDNTSSIGNMYSAETGFKLELTPWNVDLGLNLIPEQNLGGGGDASDRDVPSTSSQSPLGGINQDAPSTSIRSPSGAINQNVPSTSCESPIRGQGDRPSKMRATKSRRGSYQEPTSTKRFKFDDDDVLCLSEDEEEKKKPDFYDLTETDG